MKLTIMILLIAATSSLSFASGNPWYDIKVSMLSATSNGCHALEQDAYDAVLSDVKEQGPEACANYGNGYQFIGQGTPVPDYSTVRVQRTDGDISCQGCVSGAGYQCETDNSPVTCVMYKERVYY